MPRAVRLQAFAPARCAVALASGAVARGCLYRGIACGRLVRPVGNSLVVSKFEIVPQRSFAFEEEECSRAHDEEYSREDR